MHSDVAPAKRNPYEADRGEEVARCIHSLPLCEAAGLKVGVALVRSKVYLAEAMALLVYPAATAMASMVWVAETEIAPVYLVEAVVGAVPLVV